jgi:hypothetical protein
VLLTATVVAALCVGTQVPGQAQQARPDVAPSREFAIVCTFLKNVPNGLNSEAPRVPITEDPRFLVTARVERIERGASPWKIGSIVNFIIHSPAVMFGGAPQDGQRFLLTFSPFQPVTKRDKLWFDPKTRYLLESLVKIEK